MQKKISLATLIVSLVVAIIVTFTVTFTVVQTVNSLIDYKDASSVEDWQAQSPEDNYSGAIELFNSIYYSKGMDDVQKEAVIYHMMNAYLISIGDKYAEYYPPTKSDDVISELNGENVGIGVYVKAYKEGDLGIKILEVMDGSPAKEAKLQKGDIITHVGEESVKTLGYEGAVSKIAGEVGKTVTLTIIRDGITDKIPVTRNKFTAQSVFFRKYELDNSVGIVRILEFNNGTPAQFENAVNTLLEGGCKSLVFDVRSNPGGTLSSCLEILDFLLPKGVVVKITDFDGTVVESYYSDEKQIDVPMAVLTDGITASAGELFTSALNDYDKAILVGEKTYGKGSMQRIFDLPNGGALRITTQMYDPPKSENYDGIGIEPEVEIELDSSLKELNYFEITDAQDNQLRAAYEALKAEQ